MENIIYTNNLKINKLENTIQQLYNLLHKNDKDLDYSSRTEN